MKRGTLWVTVGRQKRAAYTGDPSESNHAVYVQAAQIEAILTSKASGAQVPVFEYTVADLPDPAPVAKEVKQSIPGAAKSAPVSQPAEASASIPEVN